MLKIKGFRNANKLYKIYYKQFHIYKKYKVSYRYFKKESLKKFAEYQKQLEEAIQNFKLL